MTTTKKDEVQHQCLGSLLQYRRAGAAVSMGVGKTRIGLRHMYLMKTRGLKRHLLVAPKKAVFKTWKAEAELVKHPDLVADVTFTTYRSLPKLNPADYDVVYLDECHSLLPSHSVFLSAFTGIVIGLTGSAPRDTKSVKGVLVNTFCPIVFRYTTDEAVNDNILNDYALVVHTLDLPTEQNHIVKTSKGARWKTSPREHYDYWTEKIDEAERNGDWLAKKNLGIIRMQAMMAYAAKEEYTMKLLDLIPEKCIVFCNTKEQADRISKHSYHSGNPESEANMDLFKDGKIKVLSCVQQLNEGINIPDLKYGIIMHSYSNERKTAQRIGRLLRLNPDDKAYVHILSYRNSVDEFWVQSALKDFDNEKIVYYEMTTA